MSIILKPILMILTAYQTVLGYFMPRCKETVLIIHLYLHYHVDVSENFATSYIKYYRLIEITISV